MTSIPRIGGVIETALYVDDLARSLEFYRGLFGFTLAIEPIDRMVVLDVTDDQVLLLFKKGASIEATVLPFGTIPSTDGDGRLHVAFGVSPSDVDAWERRLRNAGIDVQSRIDWPEGGRRLYFRDPDGHAIELKTSNWRGRLFDLEGRCERAPVSPSFSLAPSGSGPGAAGEGSHRPARTGRT